MAALTSGRATPEWKPNTVLRSYPQGNNAQIWEGGIVVLNTAGYAVAGYSGTIATGSYLPVVGCAQMSQLSPTGTDGQVNIDVHIGTFKFAADVAFTAANVGSTCYIVNDQTVSITGTTKSPAGIVQAIDGSGNPWVKLGL